MVMMMWWWWWWWWWLLLVMILFFWDRISIFFKFIANEITYNIQDMKDFRSSLLHTDTVQCYNHDWQTYKIKLRRFVQDREIIMNCNNRFSFIFIMTMYEESTLISIWQNNIGLGIQQILFGERSWLDYSHNLISDTNGYSERIILYLIIRSSPHHQHSPVATVHPYVIHLLHEWDCFYCTTSHKKECPNECQT